MVDARGALKHSGPLCLTVTRLVRSVPDKDLTKPLGQHPLELRWILWHLLPFGKSTTETEDLLFVRLLLGATLLEQVAALEGVDHDATHLGDVERGDWEAAPNSGRLVDDPESDLLHDFGPGLDVLECEDSDPVNRRRCEVDVVHGGFGVGGRL